MSKKRILRFVIDFLLIFTFILFYNTRVVRIDLHEILGIAIIVPVIIHLFLNWRWVLQVGKKLFSKKTTTSRKVSFIIDFLLFIGLALIIVSGIFISKSLFPNMQMTNHMLWRNLHISVSYITLILFSVHLGLNWEWVMSTFKKIFKIVETPKYVGTLIPIALALVFVFGAYNIFAQGVFEKSWIITKVNSTSGMEGEGRFQRGEGNFKEAFENGRPQRGDRNFKDGQPPSGMMPKGDRGNSSGFQPPFGEGERMGMHGGVQGEQGITPYLNLIVTYLSICGVFIIFTYNIRKYFKAAKPQ